MLLLFMWNKNIDKKFISLRKTPHLIKDEVSFLKTKRKGSNEFVWCSSLPHLAERVGFEPTIPFRGIHDFQSVGMCVKSSKTEEK